MNKRQENLVDLNMASEEPLDENIKYHRGCNRYRKNLSESNVLLFGIAMFLTFAAFNTSQNFATSGDATVGSISLGILYGVNAVFCIILPNIIGHYISIKVSLLMGALTYGFFVASYIHLIDIVLYITSGILGIGAGLLWIAEGTFVTSCANEFEYEYLLPFNSELGMKTFLFRFFFYIYDSVYKHNNTPKQGYFNGVFWFIFQFNQFIGNLLAALLFQFDVPNQTIFIILSIICFIGCSGFLFLKSFNKEIRYFDEEQIQQFAKSINTDHNKSIQNEKDSDNKKTDKVLKGKIHDYYDQLSWDKSATYKSHNDYLQEQLKANIDKFNNNDNDNHSSVLLYHEYHRTEQSKKKV